MKSTEQKPRKLRASCDACSRAKVKCDKVRPTCHRCGNMGICCNYSPSMRLGKPRKNRNPDGSIQRDVSPANSSGNLGPRPEMRPRTTSSTAESSPEPLDPFFFGPTTPEYPFQDAFMSGFDGSYSPEPHAASNTNRYSSDDMFLNNPESLFNSPVPHFSTPYQPEPMQSPFGGPNHGCFDHMEGPAHSMPASTGHFFEPRNDHQSYSSPKSVNPMSINAPCPLPTPDTPPISPAHANNHDCTEFAFSTLSSLYSPPSYQPSAREFGGSGGLPTLDTVLSTNKSAIDKVFILLSCPCSANPHYSTTVAFTIVKILSWYQAVAGMNSTDTPPSPIHTPMEAFTHTPITLGAFRLEGEDEERFRVQLVLGELRKVEKLVDKFSERYCKKIDSNDRVDGGVYNALETLLRTRVRDTVKMTVQHASEDVRRQWMHKKERNRGNMLA